MADLAISWVASAIVSAALSAAARALFTKRQHIEGPRLSDLTVSTSDYGVGIAKGFGKDIYPGNWDWCSDRIAHTTTTTQGGKFGGGGTDVTETTYSIHGRVSFCEGPGVITRLWLNAKLVYDGRPGGAGFDNFHCNENSTRFYPGDEEQVADSIEEALLGAGNVPGYRDKVGVVFEGLYVTGDFGNNPPTVWAEVAMLGPPAPVTTLLHDFTDDVYWTYAPVYNPAASELWVRTTTLDASTPDLITRLDPVTGDVLDTIGLEPAQVSFTIGSMVYEASEAAIWVSGSYGATHRLYKIDAADGSVLLAITTNSTRWLLVNPYTAELWRGHETGGFGSALVFTVLDKATGLAAETMSASPADIYSVAPAANGDLWGGYYGLYRMDRGAGTWATIFTPFVDNDGAIYNTILYNDSRNVLLLCIEGTDSEYPKVTDNVWKFDIATLALLAGEEITLPHPPGAASDINQHEFDPDNDAIWAAHGGSSEVNATRVADGSSYLSYAAVGDYPWELAVTASVVFATSNAYASSSFDQVYRLSLETVVAQHYWQDVVEWACEKVGLADYLSLPERTEADILEGYRITSQMTARAALEPILALYQVDGVESGPYLKFVRRGAGPVLTIDEGDLAARVAGEEAPAPLAITRGNEIEIPREVWLKYQRLDSDYEQGVQHDIRQGVDSEGSATLDFPIVLSDDRALEALSIYLDQLWLLNRYALSLPRPYVRLEGTDVVNVVSKGRTHEMRFTAVQKGVGGIRKISAAEEDSELYPQYVAAAASLEDNTSAVSLAAEVTLDLLDIPILLDEHDDAGFYAVISTPSENARGGLTLYKSSDGGSEFAAFASLASFGITGSALSTLGDFTGGNVFDESNYVDVLIESDGELASTTRTGALNGVNAFLLGAPGRWEVFIARDATLIAEKTYRLEGLLRGRRGTEWAMGTHESDDRFIVLSRALQRISSSPAEIGRARHYKAPAAGELLVDATVYPLTNQAVGLKPFAPVKLRGERDGSDNLTIDFERRTRLAWDSLATRDAPLGEASEAYEVEIWDATFATLKRTIASSTTSAAYSAAEQTTDFGSTQDPVYVRVYQLSATVGRGYVLQGSV